MLRILIISTIWLLLVGAVEAQHRPIPTAGIVNDLIVTELGPIIEGVRIGHPDDKSSWTIFFKEGTTDAQRKRAQEITQAFDPKTWTLPSSEIEVLKKRLDDLTKK